MVRDASIWDGFVDVTLSVTSAKRPDLKSDTVRLRLAPLITQHHLSAPLWVMATGYKGDPDYDAMAGDLAAAVKEAGIGGKDIFKVQLEAELGKVGITVHWIEDWSNYHRLDGEVHCGSNTTRVTPTSAHWWLARALGELGTAWAWKTPRLAAVGAGAAVRSLAAGALVDAFVRQPATREAATTALLLVDDPGTLQAIARARRGAPASLDRRVEQSPFRRPR